MTEVAKNVVLVHGGFVDGSGWEGVYHLLTQDGYNVSIVQNPTLSLDGRRRRDPARPRRAGRPGRPRRPLLRRRRHHRGRHRTTKVAALVYIAAFAPDEGESVNTLIADPPPGAPVPPILPPQDGFLFLDREKFHASFAADVHADAGRVHGRLAGALGRRRARRRGHRRRPGGASRAGTWSPPTTG